jgi:AcrR family transcriptional regulator
MSHARIGTRILTTTGRVPGRRGMETRRRLLEEVERRCLVVHHRHITVNEIAKAAETSAATFYHYFPDVAAAAAEVAANHFQRFDVVLERAQAVIDHKGDLVTCRAFVDEFFAFWERRPGLLEAIIVASPDDDPRFFRVLLTALSALTNVLAQGVTEGHPSGVAGSLVMMLSQAAARRDGFARDGVPFEALVDSQARVLHATLHARATRR